MNLSQEKISIFSSCGFAHFYTIGQRMLGQIGAENAEMSLFQRGLAFGTLV